jgi:predicted dehydrogenase
MMKRFKVGIIGCGPPQRIETPTGSRIRPGQGNVHAEAYKASTDCEIVAAADIKQENLDLFCETHNVPHGYLDHREMLATEDLDIVSVCVWPALHAPMVIDAAQAGVRAIHCEKPVAPTWGEARRMVDACRERNAQLTFHHQRRFGTPYRKAKELLDSGAIGQLVRLEAFCINLYDWGTHWFDMMFFYNDEEPVEWVMGQIDARYGRSVFAVQVEGQGLSYFRWRNGVEGLMFTYERQNPASNLTKGQTGANRLVGTDGMIDVGVPGGPTLRLLNAETGGQWREIDVGGGIHGRDHDIAAIVDLVAALKTGREPELSAQRALHAAELTFATYESSRRRARVDLPLEIEDSPLLSMLESGVLATEL